MITARQGISLPSASDHDVEPVLARSPIDLARADQSGPEPLGLDGRPGQVRSPTGDPVGEADVVLDARAGAGLTAGATASSETVSRPSDAP